MHTSLRAYTLFEIIIVLGIVSVLAMLLMPVGLKQLQGNKLDKDTYNMFSYIYTQQQNSYSRLENKTYGISFESDKFIIYSGVNLASADWSEENILNSGNRISQINLTGGVHEIHFQSGSFRPNVSGTIQIKDEEQTLQLEINPEGLISIKKL
jgi:type II secretory pathway pseudopilin PulG